MAFCIRSLQELGLITFITLVRCDISPVFYDMSQLPAAQPCWDLLFFSPHSLAATEQVRRCMHVDAADVASQSLQPLANWNRFYCKRRASMSEHLGCVEIISWLMIELSVRTQLTGPEITPDPLTHSLCVLADV